jgi:hypothetical protein
VLRSWRARRSKERSDGAVAGKLHRKTGSYIYLETDRRKGWRGAIKAGLLISCLCIVDSLLHIILYRLNFRNKLHDDKDAYEQESVFSRP